MAAAMLPSVAQYMGAGDEDGARRSIRLSVKTTMLISIPCAVGMFSLARPVTRLLFFSNGQEAEDLATALLMALSLSVVFYSLSTLNSQILQGLGRLNMPIVNAGIALAVQSAVAVALLCFTELDLYAIVAANTLYSGVMCYLNQRAVRKAVGYRQDVKGTFVVPGIAALLMGAVARAVYEGLLLLTGSFRLGLIVSIPAGVCVYFALLLLFRGVTERELQSFPKGYLLVKLAKKIRLLH